MSPGRRSREPKGRKPARGKGNGGAGAGRVAQVSPEDSLTLADLLSNPDGEPTAGDVLALLALSDTALLRRAADVLRDGALRVEFRRLLAWRLDQLAERIEHPPAKRPGRRQGFDFELARRWYELRESGYGFQEATEALSILPDEFARAEDRTPRRKAKAAWDEAVRRRREFVALLEAAQSAMEADGD